MWSAQVKALLVALIQHHVVAVSLSGEHSEGSRDQPSSLLRREEKGPDLRPIARHDASLAEPKFQGISNDHTASLAEVETKTLAKTSANADAGAQGKAQINTDAAIDTKTDASAKADTGTDANANVEADSKAAGDASWTPWTPPDGSGTALTGWGDTTTLSVSSSDDSGPVCPPTCTAKQLGLNVTDLSNVSLNLSNYSDDNDTLWWTTTEPPDDYQLNYVDSQQDPNMEVDGGGWILVRHTSGEYPTWGPWDDNLEGTEGVNDGLVDTSPQSAEHWTLNFADLQMEEMMFATADGEYWLITDPIEVKGSNFADLLRTVYKSSSSKKPYKVHWYNRAETPQDPLVMLNEGTNVLYAEANCTEGVEFKNQHGGANVYVRKRGADAGGAPSEPVRKWRPRKMRRKRRRMRRPTVVTTAAPVEKNETRPVEKPEVNDTQVAWYRGYEAGSDDESEGVIYNESSQDDSDQDGALR